MARNVIFKHGSRAQYDAITAKDVDTLYWLEDTQELFKGEVLYASGKEATSLASGLMSAADKAKLDSLSTGGAGLTAVDASVILADGEGGATIGVRLSKTEGNALELKGDGLFVPHAESSSVVEFELEEQETATDGSAKTYKMKRTEGDSVTYVGDAIEIPKDKVLKGGTFETVETDGVPYDGAEVGDPYVDLILEDTDNTHIYIPMKGLVDTAAAGDGITVTGNTVSVKIDTTNANGLAVGTDGLRLVTATTISAGAMSAEDKAALDNAVINIEEIMGSIVWGELQDPE